MTWFYYVHIISQSGKLLPEVISYAREYAAALHSLPQRIPYLSLPGLRGRPPGLLPAPGSPSTA